MIEAIIITHNEALNLGHCLDSLRGWTKRVWVVDSGSTDGTVELARARGAEVVHHDWAGYARQKNWAMANLPLEAPWLLLIDADESVPAKLRERLVGIVSRPADQVPENGFFINRLTFFAGKPIHYCGYYPSWNIRLIKRGRGMYEDREVHEHVIVANPVGYIREPMMHHDRRGLEHYMAKHNRYSTLEARALFLAQNASPAAGPGPNLAPATRRRRWLKQKLMSHLPWPGPVRFLYMYVLRLGVLDGRAGLEFCRFIALYDTLVAMKLRELRQGARRGEDVFTALPSGLGGLALPEGAEGPHRVAGAAQAAAAAAPAPPVGCVPRHAEADLWAQRVQVKRLPPGTWPAPGSVPVSVLIPVKNEQANLAECIRRVLWADQIAVIDSQSSDATVPIAQAMGAEVYQFRYSPQGWPKKKNWALEHVPWKNPWVLILDADEHMIPELAAEVEMVVRGTYRPRTRRRAGAGDGYWLNRRFMFMGQWIRGCGYYPSYNIRLFKHAVGRYERIGALGDTGSGDNEVHEHVILSTGPAGYLEHDFLHYAYPDLNVWIEKHNRYSNWEAHAMKVGIAGGMEGHLFGGPIERRRWIKRFFRHAPLRPTMRFLYSYILRRGFRDGYPGYVMSRLMAWYDFVSLAKYQEMKRRAPNPDGPRR
jgi:glycosyltransferase involved in cell wall biosynthesis